MSERQQIYSSKEDALFLTHTINNSAFWDEIFCLSGMGWVVCVFFVLIERLVKVYENIVYFYMEDTCVL